MRKYIFTIFISIIFTTSVFSQAKRSIGIMPFENDGNRKYDWLAFGIDYQLSSKLSNISSFYVPDKKIIINALKSRGALNSKITSEVVYQVGRETGINVAIVGSYAVSGNSLRLDVNFVNAFSGANIESKSYSKNLNGIFNVIDEIVNSLLDLAQIKLSAQEEIIVGRSMTSSIKAFENFCLAYIENEKPDGKMEVVTSLFRRAINEDNKFWEAYYNLGIAYFNSKNYNQALNQFSIIIQALPNFEKPYYGRGLIYLEKKEYEKAKNDFERVLEFNPNDYKSYFYLGRISTELKDFRNAKKLFDKATSINPDDSQIYFELGNVWFLQNQFHEAIPSFKRCLELNPTNYTAAQKLGECYYRTQVYYSAITQFENILEVHPNDPLANFMLGITVYKQAVLSELIEAFLELVEQNTKKNNSDVNNVSRKELYEKMALCFDRAQKARPNFLEATFNLALTYQEMGEYNNALDFYHKTLAIDPQLIKAHIKMAQSLEALGQKDKALEKYKEVIEIDPSYFVAHPTLGPAHHYINIIDVKLEELGDKLKENPNDLKSNQTLAKIYYAQGYYGKAANIYRKILTISPKNKEAKKMLAKLEKE